MKNRRNFIVKSVTALTVTFVLPTLFSSKSYATKPLADKVTNNKSWGIHIDAAKCAEGCTSCIDACNEENGLTGFGRPKTDSQWIRKVKIKAKTTEKITTMPLMCQHCENPPCCDVCPTGASFKRVDGIVMVNQHTCIGCRYCMMACPFKARSFVHETLTDQNTNAPRGKGCVESCNLCVNKIDHGSETTACEDACNKEGHNAITFGDLKNQLSKVSLVIDKNNPRRLRNDLNLEQKVFYSNI
mgnify:FL=1|tara:strand:+ start:2392 stop:3120 length:729 start_codon:yes stop_codon:yes gene_type:complete